MNAADSLFDQNLPPMGEARWPYIQFVPTSWLQHRIIWKLVSRNFVKRCAAQVCTAISMMLAHVCSLPCACSLTCSCACWDQQSHCTPQWHISHDNMPCWCCTFTDFCLCSAGCRRCYCQLLLLLLEFVAPMRRCYCQLLLLLLESVAAMRILLGVIGWSMRQRHHSKVSACCQAWSEQSLLT